MDIQPPFLPTIPIQLSVLSDLLNEGIYSSSTLLKGKFAFDQHPSYSYCLRPN